MMTSCSLCGIEMQNEKRKLCKSCVQDKMDSTWKRQIRFYSVSIVLGAGLLLYDVSEVRSLPHDGSSISVYLMGTIVLGGMTVLGGLFGLGLAMFFNMWHKKDTNVV